ncbi:MAG: hypothetical protein AUJ49_03315 [Desulfovibrionaceae bacterium CG1_02_65_16]|nr:MAG: hypothetical protein AUJ49_03315 [Desulfovibrionaceae bacterium CG1_02_65_16]
MRFKRNVRRINAGLRAVLLLMLLPTVCKAGGFALNEYAARANAMGGAMIALADDASAVAYNPAGITQLQGDNVMFGMTAIAPVANVKAGNGPTTTTQANIYTPPHAYLTHQLNDRIWLGFGLFTRFGVGTQYTQNWAGAGNIYRAELSTYSFTPNIAIKLTDKLSLAAGPEILYSSADLRKKITGVPGADMRMYVDGISYGGQAALHYAFNDQWSAGFVYHTSQRASDKGKARYTGLPTRSDQKLTITMDLPASYNFGVAYKPSKDWKIEADAIMTEWQDYKDMIYKQEYAGTSISPKYWRNVWRFQLGTEYMATDWLALRAGFVWDQDPIRKGYEDYMLPTNDRKIVSTGFGIIGDKCTYDFSVAYVANNDRSIDSHGAIPSSEVSQSRAYMAGFSIGYKF